MLKFAVLAGVVAGLVALAAVWFLASPARVAALVFKVERSRAGLQAKSLQLMPEAGMAYLDGGSGEVLLLIHGSSGEKDNWNRVARHLTPHLRVIALDLPGFGDSDQAANDAYGLWEKVAHIHAFASALGLQHFHLGGHSMGGRIAAMYAARHPDQVRSLWLLAPGGVLSSGPSELALLTAKGVANPLFIRSDEAFDYYLQIVMAQPPVLPAPVKRGFASRAIARADLQERIFDAIHASNLPLEDNIAGAAQIPARIVWGDRDRVWHVSGAGILQERLPLASLLLLPGIGHVPMIEATEQVANDYLSFLKTVPERQLLAAAE